MNIHCDNATAELTVVLPVCRPDYHLAVRWLHWAAALKKLPNASTYPLIVMFVPSLSYDQVDVLREAFGETAHYECFHGLQDGGYWDSPNKMFRRALELCSAITPNNAMLWVEPDATPTRPTWVDEIRDEYRKCDRPFMGDHVTVGQTIPHMTGNAVYPANWKAFPSLAALPGPKLDQGWDSMCAYETFANSHKADTIQQIWRPKLPITDTTAIVGQRGTMKLRDSTALFHQVKDGSLIDLLASRMNILLPPPVAAIGQSDYAKPANVAFKKRGQYRAEIFIVTFKRDIDFLRYCLKSIEKFANGFQGVTVMAPSSEKGMYSWVPRIVNMKYFDETPGKGMLHHELLIMEADMHCPGAEYILHVDADCVFWQPASPSDFIEDGKPLILREHYSKITNQNRHCWKLAVENAIGITPEYDYMVRHPQCYRADLYHKARELLEKKTGRTYDWYILHQRNEFPQTFAEFPCLGTVAAKCFPDDYAFMDYDHLADARQNNLSPGSFQYVYKKNLDKLVECWSHGGIGQYRNLLESVLTGNAPQIVVK